MISSSQILIYTEYFGFSYSCLFFFVKNYQIRLFWRRNSYFDKANLTVISCCWKGYHLPRWSLSPLKKRINNNHFYVRCIDNQVIVLLFTWFLRVGFNHGRSLSASLKPIHFCTGTYILWSAKIIRLFLWKLLTSLFLSHGGWLLLFMLSIVH